MMTTGGRIRVPWYLPRDLHRAAHSPHPLQGEPSLDHLNNIFHVEVVTPGDRGLTFITQLYFKGQVPSSFRDYVRSRGSQFGQVVSVNSNQALPSGGRILKFDIRLNQ